MNNTKGIFGTAAAIAALAFASCAYAQDDNESGLPATTLAVETDGFAPYIVGTLPFAAFELFAKAGYLVYETEARVTSPLGSVVVDDIGDEFTWSAGLGLTVFDTSNLRLEYELFDVQEVDAANALGLTGAFRF